MNRLVALAATIAVLVAGLSVRAFADGAFAKYAGVALYTVLIYTLVLVIAPRIRPLIAGVLALAISWAVEFAQLTPVPAALSARSGLARLVFGSTFNPPDLFWYAVGAAFAAAVHHAARRAMS